MKINELYTIFNQSILEVPAINSLKKHNLIDLAMITGSYARDGHDEHSDIDLFIILPLNVQKKYKLLPEYTFSHTIDDTIYTIEISFVTTEKLMSEQFAKSHYFWWHSAHCVYYRDAKFYKAFLNASKYTKTELQDKLWTLNFQFKLGMYDLSKANKRLPIDDIGIDIIYYDCIRLFMEFVLLTNGIVRRFTNFSSELKKMDPIMYSKLHTATDFKSKFDILHYCNDIINNILLENGFNKNEVNEWNKHGLTRLIFQKY